MAVCYISLKEHSKKSGGKFIKTIQEMPEVTECYIISGAFDFMLKVVSENMDDYYNFHVNKLGQLDNIAQVQSTFIMGTIKDSQPQIS
jgi:DNA-binding Lrp family transcriptional regulator